MGYHPFISDNINIFDHNLFKIRISILTGYTLKNK
jgi:hypothetical protein